MNARLLRLLFTTMPLLFAALHAESTGSATAPAKLGSAVFKYEDLAAQSSGVGERRDVARQPTATMQEFECHLSTLNAGLPSHPPHRHPQEELIILKEGTLEVFINGTTQRIGPGSLFFFASYDLHAVRNVGTEPAKYSVFNFSTATTHSLPAQPAADTASPDKLRSSVFDWQKLIAKDTKTGARRAVLDAPTVTCSRLECHVTTLNGGQSPHPAHHHPDEEIVLVKDGEIDVTINGQTQRAGAGSIFFFASNDEHGMKNAGATPATYYVLRVVTEATPKPART